MTERYTHVTKEHLQVTLKKYHPNHHTPIELPAYRSDILLVFPREGTYCIFNQAATPAERESAGKGGQGANEIQLLAAVIVKGGKAITGDPETYVLQALYDGNKNDKSLPLAGLRKGDLTPWRGMSDLKDEKVNPDVQHANFFIGTLPFPHDFPPNSPPFTQPPDQPLGPWSAFSFYTNEKVYDPARIDFTRTGWNYRRLGSHLKRRVP
jgi:hypothetical protein